MPTPNPAKLTALRATKRLGQRLVTRRSNAAAYAASANTGDALVNMCDSYIHAIKDKTVVIIGAGVGVEAEIFAQYASSVIAYHISSNQNLLQYRQSVKRATRRLSGYGNVELRQSTSSAVAAATFADDSIDVVFMGDCCKLRKSGQTNKKSLLAEISDWRPKCAYISGADYGDLHVKRAVRRTLGRKIGVVDGAIWWRHTK